MRKGVGVILIVASVLLVVKGNDVAHSFASEVKRFFAGVPLDAASKLYLASAVSGVIGLFLIFSKK